MDACKATGGWRPPLPQDANEYRVCDANRKFMEAMANLDLSIESRNINPKKWARNKHARSRIAPLPYTMLMPSSEAGVTMRGVPYLVSI